MSTKKTVENNTVVGAVSVRRLVIDYIEFSSELSVTHGDSASGNLWETVGLNKQFGPLHLLLEKVFSAVCTGHLGTRRACLQQQWSAAETTSCSHE